MEEGSGRKRPGLLEALSRFLSGRRRITEAEIQDLMDAGEEEGLINEEENEMIRSIFALRDTTAREVMVPRTDMACVPVDATVQEVLQAIGFLDPAVPKRLMPRLNQLLNRAQLRREELHILRGIARAARRQVR